MWMMRGGHLHRLYPDLRDWSKTDWFTRLVKSKEPGHFIKREKNRNHVRQMWQLGLRKLPELWAAFHPVNVCTLDGKQKVRFIRTLEALSHWLHLQRCSGEKNELLQQRSIRLDREKVIRNLSPQCRCAVLCGIYAARDTSVNTLLCYAALRMFWNDIKVAPSQVSARWESVLTKKKASNMQPEGTAGDHKILSFTDFLCRNISYRLDLCSSSKHVTFMGGVLVCPQDYVTPEIPSYSCM